VRCYILLIEPANQLHVFETMLRIRTADGMRMALENSKHVEWYGRITRSREEKRWLPDIDTPGCKGRNFPFPFSTTPAALAFSVNI
jgi:hypothetical protein